MKLTHQERIVQVLEGYACSSSNSLQRIFRNVELYIELFREPLVKTFEQGDTAGEALGEVYLPAHRALRNCAHLFPHSRLRGEFVYALRVNQGGTTYFIVPCACLQA